MTDSYRGFDFDRVTLDRPDAHPGTEEIVLARRGKIRLHVQLTDGTLPQGWTLGDVLRYEIDRLIDPKAMRDVDHLN